MLRDVFLLLVWVRSCDTRGSKTDREYCVLCVSCRHNGKPASLSDYVGRLYNITRDTNLNYNNCDWAAHTCDVRRQAPAAAAAATAAAAAAARIARVPRLAHWQLTVAAWLLEKYAADASNSSPAYICNSKQPQEYRLCDLHKRLATKHTAACTQTAQAACTPSFLTPRLTTHLHSMHHACVAARAGMHSGKPIF